MKPALLVIDMQKQYRKLGGAFQESIDQAAKYVAWAISIFKAKGLPIFHIVHHEGGPEELESDDFWELDAVAAPDRKDVIVKTKGSAFAGTDLDARLRAAGADVLVLTGLSAEYCVLSTMRAAESLGWNAVFLRGALASSEPANIPFVERISDVVSTGALLAFLG